MTTSRSRVALVLGSATGGLGRHVRWLAAALTRSGFAVTVFGPAATDSQYDFAAAGSRFCAIEIPASPRPGDTAAVRALRRRLRPVRGSGFDVVHAHGLRAGLVAALARPARCPLVVSWHNLVLAGGLRRPLYNGLERYVARAADVTVGVSDDLVARARRLGARDARLVTVPAPSLPAPAREVSETRAELGVAPGRPIVLSVGRLHPQKGYDVLVEAAARWRDRRPRPLVVIAGEGPARQDLADRIAATRAPVLLVGHRTDVADLLAAAQVAVVTSVWEGRPVFVQEALRAGTPLIATAVGGLPDVAGEAALLVPPRDVDAVDAAVCRLLDDERSRARYAERGPARAATWPTEADVLGQITALYAELAPAASPAGRT